MFVKHHFNKKVLDYHFALDEPSDFSRAAGKEARRNEQGIPD
jgi:hypothetical protein